MLFNRCPFSCFRLNSKLVSIGHFAVSRKTGSVLYRIAPGENWVKIRPPNLSHPKDYRPKSQATLRRLITRSLLTQDGIFFIVAFITINSEKKYRNEEEEDIREACTIKAGVPNITITKVALDPRTGRLNHVFIFNEFQFSFSPCRK